MNKLRHLSMVLLMIAATVLTTFADRKPNVYILATGGTIAGTGASATSSGYTSGQVTIHSLLDAVPQIQDIANITGEQVVNIGSQNMTDDVWLTLARRVNELLATDSVDGIVITHGTDTMEETAFFLNLTVKSNKPVVLTGAMRPSTAMSADGPLNLYNSVCTAADPSSKGRGVLIVMNGLILGAHGTQKMNTVSVQTFQDPNGGAFGYVYNSKPYYSLYTTKLHTTESVFDVSGLKELPKVGIVYAYSNVYPDVMDPYLHNGYKGIIHAGLGNGNIHKNIFPKLDEARKEGIVVVRSSRTPTGPTTEFDEVDDKAHEFVASWELNPQKARVLLMLALTKTNDWKKIQEYFRQY